MPASLLCSAVSGQELPQDRVAGNVWLGGSIETAKDCSDVLVRHDACVMLKGILKLMFIRVMLSITKLMSSGAGRIAMHKACPVVVTITAQL